MSSKIFTCLVWVFFIGCVLATIVALIISYFYVEADERTYNSIHFYYKYEPWICPAVEAAMEDGILDVSEARDILEAIRSKNEIERKSLPSKKALIILIKESPQTQPV